MRKGQNFTGYVSMTDDIDVELREAVLEVLSKEIRVGNRRSGGYGTCCTVLEAMNEAVPYGEVRTQKSSKSSIWCFFPIW